jgi:hypothetical protein
VPNVTGKLPVEASLFKILYGCKDLETAAPLTSHLPRSFAAADPLTINHRHNALSINVPQCLNWLSHLFERFFYGGSVEYHHQGFINNSIIYNNGVLH